MKTSNFFYYLLISYFIISCGQTEQNFSRKVKKEDSLKYADDFLIDFPSTKIQLLGTWHFSYPNNDSYKVDKSDMKDLSSELKQNEIKKVVEHLKLFKPTIICVESMNQEKTDSLYNLYKKNKYKLNISEDEQIGFRLAKELGLDKVYAVDTYSWIRNEYKNYPGLENLWDEQYYLDTLEMINWGKKYYKYHKYSSSIVNKYTVKECLKYYNNPRNLKRLNGQYLVELKTSNHNGPDSYALKWYNRNVRIFNNILKTNPKPSDRVLVIYGFSHIAILEQLFDDSPQFELIRPFEYK